MVPLSLRPSYLFAIGAPSALSALGNGRSISPEGYGINNHNYYWTETRANRNAADYFGHCYGVHWESDKYMGGKRTIIDGYPL